MVGGMATISGGVMAVYIGLGADPIAILTTSVMAAPCGLYLSKLLMPETEPAETAGAISLKIERHHVNVIDAASAGACDGLMLALNVAAMLIAFLALHRDGRRAARLGLGGADARQGVLGRVRAGGVPDGRAREGHWRRWPTCSAPSSSRTSSSPS